MRGRLQVIRDKTPDIEERVEKLYLSINSKTGYSINVAIAATCRPTKACAGYCYGLEGRLQFGAALASQARNAAFFDAADDAALQHEAFAVGRRVSRRQSFVRVFGVGDLQPGSVKFIKSLAEQYPVLQVWTATRKLDLAETLPFRANLHVMMSCDSTTTEKNLEWTKRLLQERDGSFYAAWARQSPFDKVPRWVSVVFEEHHVGKGRALWAHEPRACPATVADGLDHDGACAKCTFCFNTVKRANGTALAQLRRRR